VTARRLIVVLTEPGDVAEVAPAVRALAERGHHVELVLVGARRKRPWAGVERLEEDCERVHTAVVPARDDEWTAAIARLRLPRRARDGVPTSPAIDEHIASRSADLVLVRDPVAARDWLVSASRGGVRAAVLAPGDAADAVEALLARPFPPRRPPAPARHVAHELLWPLAIVLSLAGRPPAQPTRRRVLLARHAGALARLGR
jgi:hypothetical protein